MPAATSEKQQVATGLAFHTQHLPSLQQKKKSDVSSTMASERPHLRPTIVAYLLTTMVALLFKGAVSETTTLQEDYKEFCTIVPFDEIIEIIHHYNKTDAKVREFLQRLHDPDITEYANWLYQQKPLHKALEYLEQHGVPGYEVMTRVIALFGWPPFQRPDEHHREARSVHKMAQDVRNLVPPLALFKFYSRKMKTSKEFQDFVEILRSDEFNMRSAVFLAAVAIASAASLLHVSKAEEESLLDVLNDFKDLLPIDKINATLLRYYNNDEQVQEFVRLLRTQEFAEAAVAMNPLAGKQAILNYMQDNGVDSYWNLNYVHSLFGWPAVERANSTTRTARSAKGLVQEISDMIPTDKISALYQQKLKESPVFKGLIDLLKSDTVNETMMTTLKGKAIQDAIKKLREFGIDIDALGTLLHDLWGWGERE